MKAELKTIRERQQAIREKLQRLERERPPPLIVYADTHGLAPTTEELQAARKWLTRTVGPSQHGTSIPTVAHSIARQRLTGDVSLPEFHPEKYAERPTLPKAISQLAACAAPGYHDDRFGDIPDRWNTGACRTRTGAEQAAKVLDRAIDDIARKHFDGHTDPRDYKPRGFPGRPLDEAKEAAVDAWQSIRETIIERMVSAAERLEADEIRRRRLEEKERRRLAREHRSKRNERTEGDRDGESVPQRPGHRKKGKGISAGR